MRTIDLSKEVVFIPGKYQREKYHLVPIPNQRTENFRNATAQQVKCTEFLF